MAGAAARTGEEPDPEARAALARLLGRHGSREVTPQLVAAQADPDAEVRSAAAEALGRVGDRRALAALRAAANGYDVQGVPVGKVVERAVANIERRHPLPKVVVFEARRETPDGWRAGRYIRPHEAVHLAVQLDAVKPETRLQLSCGRKGDAAPTAVREVAAGEVAAPAPPPPGEAARPDSVMAIPVARLNCSGEVGQALASLGVASLGDLVARGADDLLAAPGVGPDGLKELRAKLRDFGLALRGDAGPGLISLPPPAGGWPAGSSAARLEVFNAELDCFDLAREAPVEVVVGCAESLAAAIDQFDDARVQEIAWLLRADPDLGAGAVDACLEEAARRKAGGDDEGWARGLAAAGRIAAALGESVTPGLMTKVRDALRGSMCEAAGPIKKRVELALIFDSLGWPADALFVFAPIPGDAGARFYLGKHLVTNGQYRRFLDAKDFRDEELWAKPYCLDCNSSPFSLQHEVELWPHRYKEDNRRPSSWGDPKFGASHPGLPVVGISWFEANAYGRWLVRHWDEPGRGGGQPRPAPVPGPSAHGAGMAAGRRTDVAGAAVPLGAATVRGGRREGPFDVRQYRPGARPDDPRRHVPGGRESSQRADGRLRQRLGVAGQLLRPELLRHGPPRRCLFDAAEGRFMGSATGVGASPQARQRRRLPRPPRGLSGAAPRRTASPSPRNAGRRQ